MADNETRIKITAVDEATAKLLAIKGAASELTGSFTRLQGALGAIGVTAALGGLAATVNAAIKTAASLEELSQKTGIATKELSALDYAMRREGVSTEAFGKAVKELSKNMIEAGDASSKAGKLFAELGVNAQGGTREALLKIADTFQALPDGATKAALAVQLFGKAGLDMIPALNNGAAGIRQIEEEARRLGITFDGETGRAAKERHGGRAGSDGRDRAGDRDPDRGPGDRLDGDRDPDGHVDRHGHHDFDADHHGHGYAERHADVLPGLHVDRYGDRDGDLHDHADGHRDPDGQQARAKEVAADAERVRLYGVLDALRSKRDMLISLGAHIRAEMQHDPMIRERAALDREVATNRTTR
jgi:hypothetical protein